MAGFALRVRDLGQKSGPKIQSRPDQAQAQAQAVQLQVQLQPRTYLGLNPVMVEMALCGRFHAVLVMGRLGMLLIGHQGLGGS